MAKARGGGFALVITVLVAWLVSFAAPAHAHEVRPAFLQVEQQATGGYAVTWKQPTTGDIALRLVPHLSSGWLEGAPATVETDGAFLLKTWNLPAAAGPIEGQTLAVDGLDHSITDVLVRVHLNDGRGQVAMVTPQAPRLAIGFKAASRGLAVPAYLRLGVEHILTGFDHLSFVLGLLLLIWPHWRLLKAITAFTVAHSISLALAALGVVHLPSALVECLVALSILFLAVELARARLLGAIDTLTLRQPWIVAFVFGLLHGLAFAGALAEVGLPPHAIPQALLLFNVGVEIGQLIFVGAVLALAWASSRLIAAIPRGWAAPARALPVYAIGSLAALWTIERLSVIFS